MNHRDAPPSHLAVGFHLQKDLSGGGTHRPSSGPRTLGNTAGQGLHWAGAERTRGGGGGGGRVGRRSRPGLSHSASTSCPGFCLPGHREAMVWPAASMERGRSGRGTWPQVSEALVGPVKRPRGDGPGGQRAAWPLTEGWAGGADRKDPASEAHGKVTEAGGVGSGTRPDPSVCEETRRRRPGPAMVRGERWGRACPWTEQAWGGLRVLGSRRSASSLQEGGLKQGEALGSNSPETPEPGLPLSGRAGVGRAQSREGDQHRQEEGHLLGLRWGRSPPPSWHPPGVSPPLWSFLG